MEKLALNEIAACVGDSYDGSEVIDYVSTDSRDIPQGCLFVALKGDNFDGHSFVKDALDRGAAAALVHNNVDAPQEKLIYCKDTQDALIKIGGLYRSKFNIKAVGITGSVGKTTTKEMIACVVSSKYKTLKTEGNYNNEIGVPKTLFKITPDHEAAVIEMGMSAIGDIEKLAQAVRPDIGVITNIGVSHIEHLGSRENILRAKLELAEGLPGGAPLILCGDNDLLAGVSYPNLEVIFYGTSNPDFEVYGTNVSLGDEFSSFNIKYKHSSYPVRLPTTGEHNVLNALAAFVVGIKLGISPEDCCLALEDYKPSGMRQNVVRKRGVTVVEDCYNASPDSMKAALTTLASISSGGKKIAVLSDMLELGHISQQSHYDIGVLVAKCADALYCWGVQAEQYAKGAQDAGMNQVYYYKDKNELATALEHEIKEGNMLWFKASRGMKLEEIIQSLFGEC